MDKSIVKIGTFFFLNLVIIQASNASTVSDVEHIENLLNQKKFSKLEKLKGEIESGFVLIAWSNIS